MHELRGWSVAGALFLSVVASSANAADAPCKFTAKQVVENFSQLFFIEKKPVEAYMKWVAPDYVQHNPIATDGRDAAIKALGPIFAANPDLKVVIREFPILHPESTNAARMALAAAQQGRYEAFHDAMFEMGPPSPASIEAAARSAGVDLVKARAAIASGAFDPQLQNNAGMAQVLGIEGTPGFVVGTELLNGALGQQALGAAIARARTS